ncbi:MAG: hypothetical protein IFK94_07315 [Acidobacteria bacterium]|uniref:Uncharacterized protein n=1 Tax=Candidatus Polarisedimenticola svalbardensis TaxID=2886004 RepID=A0A8J6XYZ4_9BACT|nr:hypothetical protein [Candidatus Polarisedimenticola svalbardensis]
MKNLFKILIAGLVLFIAAAIVQEWSYFSTAWFGAGGERAEAAGVKEEAAASTLRNALALMSHLYTSAGDPRFAERMPVTGEILAEIRDDIEYLSRNRRVQEPRLQKLEIVSALPAGENRLELRTREFWIHRTFWVDGSGESDPPRSVILYPTYRMIRENAGWRIYGWDFHRSETE